MQDGKRFVDSTEPLAKKEQYDALVKALVEKMGVWLAKADDSDADSALAILSNFVGRLPADKQVRPGLSFRLSV